VIVTRAVRAHEGRHQSARSVPIVPTVIGVALLVLVANRWGQALLDDGARLRILAPPLIGRFRLGPPGGLVPMLVPLAVGATLVTQLPRAAASMRWTHLLLLGAAGAAGWAVALALVDGWSGLSRPMELPGHYLLDVDQVGSPGAFLRGFTDQIDAYGTHVRSHPPGLVLLLWAADAVGLGGSGAAAALVIAGGASAVPALLLVVRDLAGEAMARRTLPFLVVAPAAVYVASTGDALFAGVALWGVACVVLATGRIGPDRDGLALAGGAVFGLAVLLSYGSALLVLLPVAIAWHRRRLRPLLLAAAAGATVLGVSAAAGFWWVDGLLTTRREYLESVASIRPYGYFLLANLAGLVLVAGPATVAGLVRVVRRDPGTERLALLLVPVLAIVALANLSGMSKGEVERIWLPFALCLLPAGALAATASDAGSVRHWLWLQMGLAMAIPFFVRTHW
jgi:hypothetical protein